MRCRESTADRLFARTFGWIAATGLIESRAQPCPQIVQLGLFPFEQPQPGTQDLRGILIAPGGDQPFKQR